MKSLILATVTLMALTLPVQAQHATDNTSLSTQEFVTKATISNMFEIQAAQLAEQKLSDPAYRDFAKMLITDHKRLGDELKSNLRTVKDIQMPSSLDAKHEQMLQTLKSEPTGSFERQYREGQIHGHQQAVHLFQAYAQNGENSELKTWAKNSVPTLEKHLRRAEALPKPTAATIGAAQPQGRTTANARSGRSEAASDPQELVNSGVSIVKKMKDDPQVAKLLRQAKGIYIVPEFGRGAAIVGVRGGAGLVLVRDNGGWSDPAFYDFGAISVGPQVGASGGSVVFLLMNQKAVDAFKNHSNFSLNADAGLSIVTYSANAQASWGKGDIVMWSDTAGAYVGTTISVTDVNWDDDNNRAYYGKRVDISKIWQGDVHNSNAKALKEALPG